MYSTEIQTKLTRIRTFLQHSGMDGVLLTERPRFAWITGGRDNHIVSHSQIGVASILVTGDQLLCLANQIESPRMRNEELPGTGIEVVDFPWWDSKSAKTTAEEVIAGRKIAADIDVFGLGLSPLPPGFDKLRWQLTDSEIQRYRECGDLATTTLESVCRQIRPGENEFEIAARMEYEVQRAGASPYVVLVSTDERVFTFRHPIPTARRLERYAMLVICAEYHGLIANLTRFVHFGSLSGDLERKQQAVANVDAAVNLATRPGRRLDHVFADLAAAYATNGYADEWRLHHQGGSTGYAGRDVIATPSTQAEVLENQAFAWNPSIQGTKSEDTILVTAAGIDFLTRPGRDWPVVMGHCPAGDLRRAGILVR